MGIRHVVAIAAVWFAAPFAASAIPITIDFESFADQDSVGAVTPGVTFSNATVLTAGISLNEFEFPPRSGANGVYDSGGPMSVAFTSPVFSVGGYFTYIESLTFSAYDGTNNLLASVTAAFLSNLALSGDVGSAPNEFLGLTSATGIASVVMSASAVGASFVLDDFVFDAERPGTVPVPVPEPGSLALLLLAGALLFGKLRRTRRGTATR